MLCIYVLRSQKELARYHLFILLHACFDWSVGIWNSLLFARYLIMPLILVYRETFVSLAYVVNLWSCWNSGYELDIVATTRSNRVCQSFSFSLSLSTELLEDKQGFKLGGVDTSPSYLLFQTLLPLFWTLICMIWMELTRTDAVFSRIAMVLFLCRNKSSRNVLKIYGDFF